MTLKQQPDRTLIGRTIVSVQLRPFRAEEDFEDSFDPILVLDDGSTLSFSVQENECGGQYGVKLLHFPKRL